MPPVPPHRIRTFVYVEHDVPAGQTLAEWRRARDAATRRPARRFRLPRSRS